MATERCLDAGLSWRPIGMSQVTLHKIIWLINVISNVGVEVLTSLHSSNISAEKSRVQQFVEVHADGSLNGLSRRSSAHQDDLSLKKLSKPKSKSTKSTKPRSDGSDEDKAWHKLRDRRETEVPEDLPLSSSHEDPLFAAPNPMKSEWELPDEKWTSALVPEDAEQRQSARRLVRNADSSTLATLVRIGEGVGPITYSRSPGAHQSLNRELRQRLVAQDMATIFFLLLFWPSLFGSVVWVSSNLPTIRPRWSSTRIRDTHSSGSRVPPGTWTPS